MELKRLSSFKGCLVTKLQELFPMHTQLKGVSPICSDIKALKHDQIVLQSKAPFMKP